MTELVVEQLEGGHTGSVLCVVVNGNSCIISGGENSEVAVWSSVGALIKSWKISLYDDDDVTSIVCSKVNPSLCYIACGSHIYSLNIDHVDQQPLRVFSHGCDDDDDEINQISLDSDETYLAIADDSGKVKVINTNDFSLYRTLRAHTNICSSVSFAPNGDLYSAAYDCDVKRWNVRKSRSCATVNMKNIVDDEADVENGFFSVSPPFIHSLKVSPDGVLLACGTENSLVHIFDLTKNTLHYSTTLRGHTQGVSQVAFLNHVSSNGNDSGDSSTQYLITTGNDNRICLWDVHEVTQSCRFTSNSGSSERTGKKKKGGVNKLQETSVTTSVKIQPKRVVEHSEKINSVAAGVLKGKSYVIIADNSSNLTCLTLA